MNTRIFIILLFSLAGCAGTSMRAERSPHHPADPNAPQAPVPRPSQTLAVSHPMTADAPADSPENHPREHHAEDGHFVPATQSPPTDEHLVPSEAAAVYVCPMHPEVTSAQPNQSCPECGMRLVEREGAAR